MNIASQQASIKTRKRKKLICGIGINDADYEVRPLVNGSRLMCPYYRVWIDMLTRIYSDKFHKYRKTYKECSVCDEWLLFSNFKSWMERQAFKGKQLDKDLLYIGNKIYSPERCIFVSPRVNSILNKGIGTVSDSKTGVSFDKRIKKFNARCNNIKKNINLGYFNTEQEAHQAYLKYKKQVITEVALEQDDIRLKDALLKIADTYEIQS